VEPRHEEDAPGYGLGCIWVAAPNATADQLRQLKKGILEPMQRYPGIPGGRAARTAAYPARFSFVASMNP